MAFTKVLVANRGEIAVRIIRALRQAGTGSIAVYSDADRAALHTRIADEAVHIGASPSRESYLNIERVIAAAREYGADAIHPGYGFLAENAEFAAACGAAGIRFVGPSAEAIRRMGSKTSARRIAQSAGARIVPGTIDPVTDVRQARRIASEVGYPVMIKASGGGGGKGMRRVDSEVELKSALRDAASEAERAFGTGQIYIEKLLVRPRHVEVQVLGDNYGHLIHLGERECSLQRRHQKVLEEAPSPLIAHRPDLRRAMGEAAVNIARSAGYSSAGTLEFLVDESCAFYFLEMNTRLQVEHPVTELVTGVDLVSWQLRLAAGEPLPITQDDLKWRGSAIQCRLYAEDPDRDFFPSPGRISGLNLPSGPGVRVDSGAYDGWTVPVDYDPLIAKLIAWAPTRDEAVAAMQCAADETFVGGIKTNITFFRRVLRDAAFRDGRIHTGFIEEFLKRSPADAPDADVESVAALVALVRAQDKRADGSSPPPSRSRWVADGRTELLR